MINKELMLGDWAIIDHECRKIEQITKSKIGYHTEPNECIMHYARHSNIEPIKVTLEWLELNKMDKPFYCGDFKILVTEYDQGFKPYLCSIFLQGWGIIAMCEFKYVHELQNEIRNNTKEELDLQFADFSKNNAIE